MENKNIVKSLLLSSLALGLFITANNITVNASTGSNVTSEKITNNQKTITIQFGDTVSEYAVQYNSTVKDIAELNHLANANVIYAGNKIVIPVNSRKAGQSIYDGWNSPVQGTGNVQAQPVAAQTVATPVNTIPAATAIATPVQVSVAQSAPDTTMAQATPAASEAPSASVVASQTPASQAPASQAPTSQTPASQTPASQTPASQTPASETPASQTPASQTPASQAPASQTPASQTPASETPASQTPASQTPASQTPASQTPASQTPASQTPSNPGVFTPTEAGVKAALQAKVSAFGLPSVHKVLFDGTTTGTLSGAVDGDVDAITSDQQIADMMWDNSNASLIQHSLPNMLGLDLQSVAVMVSNGQVHATFTIAYQEK